MTSPNVPLTYSSFVSSLSCSANSEPAPAPAPAVEVDLDLGVPFAMVLTAKDFALAAVNLSSFVPFSTSAGEVAIWGGRGKGETSLLDFVKLVKECNAELNKSSLREHHNK